MAGAAVLFLVSALTIIAAGSLLTRFADKLSEQTGLGRLLIGGILLAGATSMPEIIVDLNVLSIGQPDLAVGDLFGSSLFNLLILMAVSAYFPWGDTGFEQLSQQHSLAAALGIVLTSIIGLGLISNLEFALLGAGLFPWFALICYLLGMWLLFKDEGKTDVGQEPERSPRKLLRATGGFSACAAVILVAAPYIADSADELARVTGLGGSFIGATLVALSTSMPELVSTIAAFRMRCPDLAAGNVFGSNMYNMVMFLPLDWYYTGNLLRASSDINAMTAMGVIFCASVTVVTLIHPPSGKKALLAGNGLVALSILGVLFLLYYAGGSNTR